MSTPRQSVLFDAPGPRARRRILLGNVVGAVVVIGVAALVLLQLGRMDQLTWEKWGPVFTADAWENFFLPGLWNTLRAAGLAIIGAVAFGLLFGIGRLSRARSVRWAASIVVEFFRAVPVLLMMIFLWLLLAQWGVADAPFLAVVIALVLYNGSVVAELVRSGVFGLPAGQREAALAIGLTRGQSLRSVEVPQALIAMLPALISQLVVVLKDSALGQIITYTELLQESRRFGSAYGNILQALFVAAVLFIVINWTLTLVARWLSGFLSGRTAGTTSTGPGIGNPTMLQGTAPEAATARAGAGAGADRLGLRDGESGTAPPSV